MLCEQATPAASTRTGRASETSAAQGPGRSPGATSWSCGASTTTSSRASPRCSGSGWRARSSRAPPTGRSSSVTVRSHLLSLQLSAKTTEDLCRLAVPDPVWSVSKHGPSPRLLKELQPLLQRHNVALYFVSDEERSRSFVARTEADGAPCCCCAERPRPFGAAHPFGGGLGHGVLQHRRRLARHEHPHPGEHPPPRRIVGLRRFHGRRDRASCVPSL